MIVYLLRHGLAEDSAQGGDDRRALTRDGRDRLERACPGWQRLVGRVDRVFASPLLRAQQTAAIFQRAVAADAEVVTDVQLAPSARPMRALELLQAEMGRCQHGVACIGHEPHLGFLLGLLLTGSERVAIPFKKGMLVAVEIESSASMIGRLVAALSQKLAAV